MTNGTTSIGGGRGPRWALTVVGSALLACVTVGPKVPPPHLGLGPAADLTVNVVFSGNCPIDVAVAAGNGCANLDGTVRKRCGRASRNRRITFVDPTKANAFAVYFDPSQPGVPTNGQHQVSITVLPNAPYGEYKYTLVAGLCPNYPLDPQIIIEN